MQVRTSDNVELLLEGTIFWSVRDVPRMIERTGDPKGDVWYHARSALIQAVSSVTLEHFMASFNTIVSRAAATDASFYEERGVQLHSLEVTSYECADAKTAGVLQEIIQETTNRINRMQKQRSDNEVQQEVPARHEPPMFDMNTRQLVPMITRQLVHMLMLWPGEVPSHAILLMLVHAHPRSSTQELSAKISLEKKRTALIDAKTANDKLQASVEGEAEGTRLAQSSLAFLSQLNASVAEPSERLQLLRFFSEQQTLTKQTEHLATGKATLFLTPQDVNLKLQVPNQPR